MNLVAGDDRRASEIEDAPGRAADDDRVVGLDPEAMDPLGRFVAEAAGPQQRAVGAEPGEEDVRVHEWDVAPRGVSLGPFQELALRLDLVMVRAGDHEVARAVERGREVLDAGVRAAADVATPLKLAGRPLAGEHPVVAVVRVDRAVAEVDHAVEKRAVHEGARRTDR